MTARSVTDGLFERLEHRYQAPEWALFRQVRNAAGFEGIRTADAIAMNLWPSRGLTLHGFEVKASRGDWLRELREPGKAEPVAKFCDFWWVVVPDAEMVRDELPDGWGLLVPNRGKGLRVAVEAPQTEAIEFTRSFLGALLRRAYESKAFTDRARMRDVRREGVAAGREAAADELRRMQDSRDMWRERAQEADQRWSELEDRLGLQLDGWRPSNRIRQAILFAVDGDIETRMGLVRRVARDLRSVVDQIEEVLTEVERTPNAQSTTAENG